MKTSEFVEKILQMGLSVRSCPVEIEILSEEKIAARVSKLCMYAFHTGLDSFWRLELTKRKELLDLIYAYSCTPNQER